jgi:anti-sigma factor ChrR (cupin superfamily)
MTIDFDDLELALAELASAGASRPRPEVKARLMARLRSDGPELPTGFSLRLAADNDWRPHPVPGIRMKVLALNQDHGYATLLLDVAPGARFPSHRHEGAEECYVVSGTLFTCGRRLGPGDFIHADAHTDHGELWTDVGCQVILIVPPEPYMIT